MRKTVDVTIETEGGRDNGKTFHITEMPALQAAKWADKAIFALAGSGVDLSPQILKGGMASIAALGIQMLLRGGYTAAEPLIDEMMVCVKIKEPSITRALTPDDIEEPKTYFILRDKVLELHLGFSIAGALSILTSGTPA